MNFENFQFDPSIRAGIEALGYTIPTPIQKDAIPAGLAGRDVLGMAQTGTGKTAAFVLPILQRLLPGPRGKVRALIIAPTRELAEQIHEAIVGLGAKTGLRSMTIYGGVSMDPQVRRLRSGTDIIVACPGRLLDHIGERTIDLKHLEVLVLDEADRMFDMGFLPDIRRILRHIPSARQTLFFSATMPDSIRMLTKDILVNPVTVQIGLVRPADAITHALFPVEPHLKTPLLLALLQHTDTQSVLVFTRTKHRAKRLAQQIERAGYSTTSLHGNRSQNQRQAALDGFRSGEFQILVATDIAARGIDVESISHVINYDIPDTPDAYIHRIGRTGRAAKSGDAFTLVTAEDTLMIQQIERALKEKLERRRLDDFDYKAAAPARDTEFARDPRQPQVRRQAPAAALRPTPATTRAGQARAQASAPAPQRSTARPGAQRPVHPPKGSPEGPRPAGNPPRRRPISSNNDRSQN